MAKYRGRGRKFKLTPTVRDRLCEAISIGASEKVACLYAGVSASTYYSWMKQAREVLERLEKDTGIDLTDNELKYLDLLDKVEKAQSLLAINCLSVIDTAAMRDPAWALKTLRMRFKGDFQEDAQRLDITSGDKPLGAGIEAALAKAWPVSEDEEVRSDE